MNKLVSLVAACFMFISAPVLAAERCDTPETVKKVMEMNYPGVNLVLDNTDQKQISELYAALKIGLNITGVGDPQHRLDIETNHVMMFMGKNLNTDEMVDFFITFDKNNCGDSFFLLSDQIFQQAVKTFRNQQT